MAQAWDIVSVDVLELPPTKDGYCKLLVFADNLSKYVEAIPFLGEPTAKDTVRRITCAVHERAY